MYVTVTATTTELTLLPKDHQEQVPLPEYRLRYRSLPVTAVKCGSGPYEWAHVMEILTPEDALALVLEGDITALWVGDVRT